ncbi:hypothetical protein HZA33_03915 [Candidatus Pacearchaeota archaeon]|nr:hypothetical protein [Candidatus Pacearchaeota archaeon]
MVKLFKQSYGEARTNGFREELELVGMVSGHSSEGRLDKKRLEEVNTQIEEAAEKLGATHVFGIVYQVLSPDCYPSNLGVGDAYRSMRKESLIR